MKKKQTKISNKHLIFTFVLLGILAVVGVFGLTTMAPAVVQNERAGTYRNKAIVSLDGRSACIPLRDTAGTSAQECMTGVKVGNDYYAIKEPSGSTLGSVGSDVRVSGVFVPAKADDKYNIAGTVISER